MQQIITRILHQLGDGELIDKLLSLTKPDLNSLLLELFRKQTATTTPRDLLKSYDLNRFSSPSNTSPVQYHRFEADLLELAERIDIESILLSPSAPLGSCSAFGCVDQNNVVSALRGTETLSDPTNMLAIIIASGLKNKSLSNQPSIHRCTTARVVRAPKFSGKGRFAHFGLFCIVSSGKDSGSYQCEKELILKHLQYYKLLFLEKYNAELSVTLRKRGSYTDSDGFFDEMTRLIQNELPDVPMDFDLAHADNNYYHGINFKIYIVKDGEKIEIGDGGFVDWIQRMTGNKKERSLISGIGMDRMMMSL